MTNTEKTRSAIQVTAIRISPPIRIRRSIVVLAASISLIWGPVVTAQGPPTAATNVQVPALPAFAGRSDLILQHLDSVITWYHSIGNQVPTVGLPTDSIFQSNARTLAVQVVQAAFQSASADALLLTKTGAATPGVDPTAQDISKVAPQIDAQIAQAKASIEALGPQIASAKAKNVAALQEERVRLQGDLELLTAEDNAVDQLAKFSASSGTAGGSRLQQSITQLQRNVPEASPSANNMAANKVPVTTAAPSPVTQQSTGLISEAGTLFSQASSLHRIDLLAKEAMATEDVAKQLRAPLLQQIHQTVALAASWAAVPQQVPQPGSQPSSQPAASSPDVPAPTRQQFDELTVRFKRLSSVSLPLSQEIIDLDQSRTNLAQWRQSLAQENHDLLRRVLTRVGIIAASLAALALFSALWRRFIFRYVQDIRRRRQILILRRFVIGFMMGIVIILGFVSEFSSLATFAGFITAGLAVGLQTILLSVAAYFFLIGRYGIRVGDRISISGITGDVIDVGLIRLYLMELAGTGNDLFPTGRIVVFPNSVLFQATVPLFKQIPGTDYAWHEVAATLNAGVDPAFAQQKLLAAVNSVHEDYRSAFEKQHAASSRVLDIRIEIPTPSAHLQFAASGLELVVRYPVALGNVAKADDEVTQKVLAALQASADFKNAVSGTPLIRVAVKG